MRNGQQLSVRDGSGLRFLWLPLAGAMVAMACAILAFVILPTGLIDQSAMLLVVIGALSTCVIAFFLWLVRERGLFHPLYLLLASTIVGGLLRSFYIAFADGPKFDFLTDSVPLHDIAGDAAWYLLGIFMIVLGYLLNRTFSASAPLLDRLPQDFLWPRRTVLVGVGICWLIYFVGLVLYLGAIQFEFSDLSDLSRKRYLTIEGGLGDTYATLGQFRFICQIMAACLIVFLIWGIRSGEWVQSWFVFLAMAMLGAAFVVPLIASSRTAVLLMLFNILLVLWYRQRLRRFWRLGVAGLAAALAIGGVMATLRSGDLEGGVAIANPIESIVAGGNFFDLPRTSIIISRVDETNDLLLGETYIAWMVGMVPRSVWPEKPPISLGPYVRAKYYNQVVRNNGFPPGVVAEAYMNFGAIGVPLVCFVFGFFVCAVYRAFAFVVRDNDGALALFTAFAYHLGISGPASNVSLMMASIMKDAALVMFVVVVFSVVGRVLGRSR